MFFYATCQISVLGTMCLFYAYFLCTSKTFIVNLFLRNLSNICAWNYVLILCILSLYFVLSTTTQNLTETFKQSPKYELLTYMGKRVFDNIDIQRHGYIDIKLEPADFRNSEQLLQKSKLYVRKN